MAWGLGGRSALSSRRILNKWLESGPGPGSTQPYWMTYISIIRLCIVIHKGHKGRIQTESVSGTLSAECMVAQLAKIWKKCNLGKPHCWIFFEWNRPVAGLFSEEIFFKKEVPICLKPFDVQFLITMFFHTIFRSLWVGHQRALTKERPSSSADWRLLLCFIHHVS